MKILIDGPIAGSYSLAVVNRAMACELIRLGLDVFMTQRDGPDVLTDPFFQDEPLFSGRYIPYAEIEDHRFDVHSKNDWPVFDTPKRAPLLVAHCYAWEETTFPIEVITKLENFDAIFTASEFTSEALRSSGYTGVLACIHNGIDHMSSPSPEPVPKLPQARTTFTFLHISSGLPRKGMDSGIKAFAEEFGSDETVRLVIKTQYIPENTIYAAVDALPDAIKDRIEIIDRHLTTEQISALIASADACFFPSRGEGFLLPAAEAMDLGIPVCVTACGGNTAFCTDDTAILIPTRLGRSGSRISSGKSAWFEASIADIRAGLRRCHGLSASERHLLVTAAKSRVSQFKWSNTARLFSKGLTALLQTTDGVSSPRREPSQNTPVVIISTYNQKCGIATFSKSLSAGFGILGIRHTIVSEKLAADDIGTMDEADVSRVWKRDASFSGDILKHFKALPKSDVVIQHHPGIFSWDALRDLVVGLEPLSRSIALELHSTDGLDPAPKSLMHTIAGASRIVVHNSIDYLKVVPGSTRAENLYLLPHAVESGAGARTGPAPSNTDAIKVFAFGLCGQHKQFEVILKLIYYLKLHGYKATATIVTSIDTGNSGAIVYGHNLWTYRQILGLDDDVELIFDFLPIDRILEIARSCSVAIFPYADVKEGASGAARVAMSAGLPILVSDSSIFDDIKSVCQSCSVTDIGHLTDTVMSLLGESSNARERQSSYMDFATWEKHALRLSQILNASIAQKGTSPRNGGPSSDGPIPNP